MVYKPTYNWGAPPCGAQSRFFLWFLSMSSQVASSLSPWCNGLQLLHGMARSRLRLNVASMAAADKNGGWEMLCGALRHMEVGKWGSFGVTWGSLGIPEMMGCCEWDFLGDFNRILWTGSDRIWWALDGFNIFTFWCQGSLSHRNMWEICGKWSEPRWGLERISERISERFLSCLSSVCLVLKHNV